MPRTKTPAFLAFVFGSALSLQASAEASGEGEAIALTAQGRALILAGKSAEADATLRKAAKLRGQSIDALYEVARVKLAGSDYKAARAACTPLSSKDAEAVLTQVCLARAQLVWRRASKAAELLEQARARDASHPEVLLAFADMQRLAGDVSASKDAYQQVLGLDPDNAEAYYGLGLLYLVAPDHDAAKRAFSDALARQPAWPDAQHELGKLSSGTEAVELLGKAVAARPGFVDAKLALGSAKLEMGDAAGAEALFRDVLKTQKDNALAHARLGMALEAEGDFIGAETELKLGLVAAPNDALAAISLARVYAKTDRSEEAFDAYRAAAGLERQNPRALIEAGALAMKLSRHALAQAFFEKAFERAPDSAAAHAGFADASLARGDKASAKEHYRLAMAGKGSIDREDVQKRLAALQ
jgi:tetratricopeptide (TPR) repeat protein